MVQKSTEDEEIQKKKQKKISIRHLVKITVRYLSRAKHAKYLDLTWCIWTELVENIFK